MNKKSPYNWLVLLHIMNDGYLASLPLLLPFIQKDLHIAFGRVGILTSLLSSAGVILALPAASISRCVGSYNVLLFSMLFYALSFFVAGLSGTFSILIFSFIIASIGFGLFHPVSFAIIANNSKKNDIGIKMGSFTAMGDIGRIGISACVTILISFVHWRKAAFIYGSLPAVIFCLLTFVFRREGFISAAAIKTGNHHIHGLHTTKQYGIALVTGFLDGLSSSAIFIYIPFLFVYRGASPMLLGTLTGAFFAGNMLGKIVIGKTADKVDSKTVFIISELLMAVLLLLLSAAKNIACLMIISVILGTVTKGTVPVINTLIAKAVPDQRLNEKAFSIAAFVTGIAAVLSPILSGFTAQAVDITAVFKVNAGLALISALPLLFDKMKCTVNRT